MLSKTNFWFVLFGLLLLVSCTSQNTITLNDNKNQIPLTIDNNKIYVEVAKTPAEQEQGLMFRNELSEDAGMLFVFDDVSQKNFWMKNTLIPLDMIFIDKNKKIVSIQSAVPCEEDPCVVYASPAQYVLEVNQGYAEHPGIKEGDVVLFDI